MRKEKIEEFHELATSDAAAKEMPAWAKIRFDRRRLRRITAALCLLGYANVAKRLAKVQPRCWTMRSPNRCGHPSGH
eukprot:3702131-Pyramimonas_sp.AAC.1